MSPRLAAFVCLLAVRCLHAEVTLVVSGGDHYTPAVLQNAKAELLNIFRDNPAIQWRDERGRPAGESYEQMIVVRLLPTAINPKSTSLASAHISGKTILPFVDVHGDRIGQLLAEPLAHEAPFRRDLLLGRALGRVIAHEIYHVLTQTPHHGHSGLAKAAFSTRDLLANEFRFTETLALARHSRR